MKKILSSIGIAAALSLPISMLSSASYAAVPESQDPIKIAVNEWTGQHLSANITAAIFRKMGYTVELVTAGGLPQFIALAQGELHANPEVWDNSITEAYTKAVDSGDIVILGELGLDPKEGWIYPAYMEEKCPGLPSYKALYDCAQAFATAETFPNGRLITYPADWGTRSKDVVAGTGLPFTPVAGGSEGAMIAELKSAFAAKEPILMMFWQPHWMFTEIDPKWVEWNSIEGECVEENQSKDTACGFNQAKVSKIVSSILPQKWPAAAALLKRFTLSNAEQNSMILAVDQKGEKLSSVVNQWMVKNEAVWQEWIK
ncbi:MAG: glycine betaine/proline transport system substrate-binding protein [Oceanospirillaceae bacterium]